MTNGAARLLPLVLAALAAAGAHAPPTPVVLAEPEAPEIDDGSADGPGVSAALEDFVIPDVLPTTGIAPHEVSLELAHLFAPYGLDEEGLATFTGDVAASVGYLLRNRDTVARWLQREGRYGDLIRTELRAAGLPEDLVYLAMIESGFNPLAVSRARATGMWQFMSATGREAGLRIDEWVDERRDPVASTRAAIRHLRDLQGQTGDWALTAAAYNAGLGRVTRVQEAVRRETSGAVPRTDYFGLIAIGRLPLETRRYVPLITAAAHIAHHRVRYGFPTSAEPPLAFDTVEVPPRTRLSAVAAVAALDPADLKALNPHLLGAAVPPGKPFPLRVPAGTPRDGLHERLAALPVEQRILPEVREVAHVVKAGDSWWRIADRYRVRMAALRALNPRIGDTIHPGQRIIVERRTVLTEADLGTTSGDGGSAAYASAPAPERSAAGRAESPRRPAAETSSGTYTVRPGDTLSELAESLGVPMARLVEWNGMEEPRPLRIGERLRVRPPTHEVLPGETLTGLARRYGVTVADLVDWNGMGEARGLRIGEVVVVSAPR